MATKSNLDLFPAPEKKCISCGSQTKLCSVTVIVYSSVAGTQKASKAFRLCQPCAFKWRAKNKQPRTRTAFRNSLAEALKRIQRHSQEQPA